MLYWLLYEQLYRPRQDRGTDHRPIPRVSLRLTSRDAVPASLTSLFLCVILGPWTDSGNCESFRIGPAYS